jgi:4-hydroxy-L-threonine phosphate dehydrogenase PdxA
MRQKTSGTSDEITMDVGNPKLHERHEVALEKEDGEVVSRARVTDQLEIDRLLLANKITSLEHKASEYLLQVFVDAGVFVKTVNMNAISSGRFAKSNYNYGLLRFRDTAGVIEEAVGEDAAVMVFNAIAKDLPVLDNELPFFRLAMQALDKNYIKVSFD